FMRHVRDVRIGDGAAAHPLVARETLLAAARLPEPPDFPPQWTWAALGSGTLAALVLLGLARMRRHAAARIGFALVASALALACGLGGLLLIALWTLTEHISAWRNENLLLLDPLCLLLLPAWLSAMRADWRPSRFALGTAYVVATLAALALFLK